ncbi:MAG: hypothetical protein PVH77_11705 [Phycisphaerales bacterium]
MVKSIAQASALPEAQQRPGERGVGRQDVTDEDVAIPLVHVRAGGRVPAEVVGRRTATGSLEGDRGVDQRVVPDPDVRAVEDADAIAAVHKDVARADCTLANLEEEADEAVLGPVVDEDGVPVSNIVPDAVRVRVVHHQVVTAGDTVRLVEYLDGGREIAREILDVIAAEDVPFEQNVGRADDVHALGARVTEQGAADSETIAAEVAGHARAEGNCHVIERGARDLFAVCGGVGRADWLVGRLIRRAEAPLALDFNCPPSVLGEGDSANYRPLMVVRLAVDGLGRAHDGAVEGGNLDEPVPGVDPDEDVALFVVDEV